MLLIAPAAAIVYMLLLASPCLPLLLLPAAGFVLLGCSSSCGACLAMPAAKLHAQHSSCRLAILELNGAAAACDSSGTTAAVTLRQLLPLLHPGVTSAAAADDDDDGDDAVSQKAAGVSGSMHRASCSAAVCMWM
jgi:hypothetical protein